MVERPSVNHVPVMTGELLRARPGSAATRGTFASGRSYFPGSNRFACRFFRRDRKLSGIPSPLQALRHAAINHVLEERRIARQHQLIEILAEIFNDAEDFGGTVAGCDQREGIALLRQIAAALGGNWKRS